MVKQLWLRLIHRLQSLSLIELPPNLLLEKHTTLELINLVKRILTGPRTCMYDSSTAPKVVHEVVLKPGPASPRSGFISRVKLVGGCRLVIIAQPIQFEIWDISAARRIWTCPAHIPHRCAELWVNGRRLTVVVIYREPYVPSLAW